MVFVALKPAYARRLAENLRDHAWLFRHAHRVEELEGAERLDAVSELTLGLSIAAFSPRVYREATWDKPKTIEEWLSYYRELLERNADSIRLVFDRAPIDFSAPGQHDQVSLFGHLRGFTQVVQLTDKGFERFTGSNSGITALTSRHVVAANDCHGGRTNLYIGGVVDVRAFLNEATVARRALDSPVLRELMQHIASFAPELKWTGGDDTRLTTPTGGPLPRFCAFSGRDTDGWYLLEGAGLRPIEEFQLSDAPKYLLDLNDWNTGRFHTARRHEVRRSINAFQRAKWIEGDGPAGRRHSRTSKRRYDNNRLVAKRGDSRQEAVKGGARDPGEGLSRDLSLGDLVGPELSGLAGKPIDAITLLALFEQAPPDEQTRFLRAQLRGLLSAKEAAERVGLTPHGIKRHAQRGEIGTLLGRDWFFTPQEVEGFARQERRPGPQPQEGDVTSASGQEHQSGPRPQGLDSLVMPRDVGTSHAADLEPSLPVPQLLERLRELRDPDAIEAFLDRFVVGKSWDTLVENQDLAYGITDHLRSLKLRVACSKDGAPSYLRAYRSGGAPDGAFYFEHSSNNQQQTHGGTKRVPPLKIVPAPPRNRRGGLGSSGS